MSNESYDENVANAQEAELAAARDLRAEKLAEPVEEGSIADLEAKAAARDAEVDAARKAREGLAVPPPDRVDHVADVVQEDRVVGEETVVEVPQPEQPEVDNGTVVEPDYNS